MTVSVRATLTRRLRLFAVFAVGLLVAAPVRAQSVEVIPPSGRWVTDQGEFLAPAEETSLSRRLAQYADSTSTQIVIVTLQSLDGAAASDYAVELGRRWGVGQAGYNNGVVILVSREDRQMFIATGYGLEGAIPDAVASRIYRDILVPNFRQSRFYDGLSQAVDALILAATGEYVAPAKDGGPDIDLALIVVLVILVVFIVIALRDSQGGDDTTGFEPPSRRRRRHYGDPPIIILGGPGSGRRGGGMGGGGFGGFGGGGFGGFGGGGGSFGGGGAGGGW